MAGEDGRARRVKVQLGATSPRLAVVAVTGDLTAGEQVILMPMGFTGGERVRVTNSPVGALLGPAPTPRQMKRKMTM